MTFDELLAQVLDLLQREGRMSYRALKRRFHLDDDDLEDLKDEIIAAKQLAIDEQGKVLVWTGDPVVPRSTARLAQTETPPDTLSSQAAQTAPALAAPHAPEAERRQLTVLFCDLVDSTPLARQLDPEDLREVVRAYQATAAEVIQRFAGHIAQYLGDGLLVYFGYPQAHEDDALRAIHTGLRMVEAIGSLNTALVRDKGVRLAVRVGIHTGLVVVGEMGGGGRHERLALGETPNVAARLQGLAAPDTVVISAATQQLVQGLFTCQGLGAPTLKGLDQPLAVYHVLGVNEAQSRFEVAITTGLPSLVGREEEVGLLRRRWEQAREGHGQVVLLSGEAGIGKSRLVWELQEDVEREGATRLGFRCSPYAQQSALYPMIEHVQRVLQWRRDEPPEAKLDKLERMLQRYRLPLQEAVPLLAALLSLPHPEHYPPLHLSPERQKQKTQEALIAWLVEEAEQQPVLAVWEDLHWADPSTLEWLGLFLGQAPTVHMLTLLTCRPEFHPPWAPRTHLSQLTLRHLTGPQVEAMVRQVAQGKTVPAEVVRQIVAKTDGVPLFVEEITKTVLESGWLRQAAGGYELTGPLPPLAIPATLHDALMARLDRLSAAKTVAQLGATLGRTFSYEVLQAVSPLDEATLQRRLRQLVEAELVYQHGVPPQATYLFKHALIQNAAYQSLLRTTRQQYHQRIAQVLAERFPETTATQPELLAHHYTEAGLIAQAVPYWQCAGQQAIEHSAHVEAISHLTRGLELLKALPDTPERTQQELVLHLTLGAPLNATKGPAAPEVEQAYARARELSQQVGETPQLFPGLYGLWRFSLVRAELQTARELGEQLLRLAQSVQDSTFLLEAHQALGVTLFFLGEFAPARLHLEQGITLYNPQQHRSLAFRFGEDIGVVCLSHTALALWCLGYPAQALERIDEALTLGLELSHPHTMTFAHNFAAALHQLRLEVEAVQEQAEAGLALAREHGFPLWLAWGTMLRGWALAEQTQGEEGLVQMRAGLDAWRATGAELLRPYFLALLIEAYWKVGQVEEGLAVLAEPLAVMHKSGERLWEAELQRLQGELLLQSSVQGLEAGVFGAHPALRIPHAEEAEAAFRQALTMARRQQAKSLELRAALSLSRLWQRQGKHAEALELLAEVYGWFTEGFDTADLQEAKALLEQL